MTERAIQLDTAAFLDSRHARDVAGLAPAELRRVCEAFLTACYEEWGKAPKDLDGQDLEGLLVERLPAHFAPDDALAERVPRVLAAYLAHLGEHAVVTQAFELQLALDRSADAFLERVRSGSAGRRAPAHSAPFVHGAAKLGRNDPCSCGSGKKFKKCHGKDA
jgi:hypothetical protein